MAEKRRILLGFHHGLGDAVQFTIVLAHLARERPEWEIEIVSMNGKETAWLGFPQVVKTHACRSFEDQSATFDRLAREGGFYQAIRLPWHESVESWGSHPSTKAERCLIEYFGLMPDPKLCSRYWVKVRDEVRDEAASYLAELTNHATPIDGRFPVLALHYQGNTSQDQKNLSHQEAAWILAEASRLGFFPIVLDWENPPRTEHVGMVKFSVNHPYWRGRGTGDAERVVALIQLCAAFVGIDSGPQKCAAATDTPTVAVWSGYHPLHYLAPAKNVINIVRPDAQSQLRGDQRVGQTFFVNNYRIAWQVSFLWDVAAQMRNIRRDGGPRENNLVENRPGIWLRGDNFDQDFTVVRDVIDEDCYNVPSLPGNPRTFVDVGGHIGSFALKVRAHFPLAKIVCVEAAPENWPVLEKNVGGFAGIERAACTYDENVALLNAVYPNCLSTGGSVVVPRAEAEQYAQGQQRAKETHDADGKSREYWGDLRTLPTVTLEKICTQYGFDSIDVLKLDCEGSEYSILSGTSMLDRVKFITGEYHDRAKFDALIRERFQGWPVRIVREGDPGLFEIRNPRYFPA